MWEELGARQDRLETVSLVGVQASFVDVNHDRDWKDATLVFIDVDRQFYLRRNLVHCVLGVRVWLKGNGRV